MEVVKIFTCDGGQAVRLPKDCRFSEDEVLVNRIGNVVVLLPKSDPWCNTLDSLDLFTDDFLADGIPSLPIMPFEDL